MEEVFEAEANFSTAWWESRTSEQLRDMIRGGLSVGDLSVGAHREIERRAREGIRLEMHEATLRILRQRRFWMLTGTLIVMLSALSALLLLR